MAREELQRRPCAAALLAAGVLLLVGSFAGLGLLGNFVSKDVHRLLLIPLEEVGEMVGATLILWGVYTLFGYGRIALLAPASAAGTDGPTNAGAGEPEPRRSAP